MTTGQAPLTADEMRRKFAGGPIGKWTTVVGTTVDDVAGETWEFRADGSGQMTAYGGWLDEETDDFEWRLAGDGRIELRLAADAEGEAPNAFRLVVYEFVAAAEPEGVVVLREVDHDGFWLSVAPLRLVES